jgi:glutathione S-transferase
VSELILHHHDPSPFAEKIRLAFGIKQLAWRSFRLSMVMPRPELMPLTGGCRKVPVLQAGADNYCDTRLIARKLERRHPAPPLFPAGSGGLALALASWSDRTFFEPDAALAIARASDALPGAGIDASDSQKFRYGDRVTVTPDDYCRIPVEGELVTLSIDEAEIRRAPAEAGEVVVHLPRLGYRVTRVA